MGLFDQVYVPCPRCGTKHEAQSKSGGCSLEQYELHEAPADVLVGLNWIGPLQCSKCGANFKVAIQTIAYPVLSD